MAGHGQDAARAQAEEPIVTGWRLAWMNRATGAYDHQDRVVFPTRADAEMAVKHYNRVYPDDQHWAEAEIVVQEASKE